MKSHQYFIRLRERLRFKYGPRIANLLVANSIKAASKKMEQSGGVSVLIDNTVLGHATTHKTGWVSTGTKEWGGQKLDTGYAARMPVHLPDTSILYRNVCFLPGIAGLVERGNLRIYSSSELKEEMGRQPIGRFIGYSYYDLNLFADLRLQSVDGYKFSATTSFDESLSHATAAEAQRDRLKHVSDPVYDLLLQLLGDKNSQDAFHLLTAAKHGLFCFLTMDFKFRRAWESARKNKKFPISTPVMTPEEFGEYFQVKPVHPYMLSYKDASFPVKSDILAPGKPGK